MVISEQNQHWVQWWSTEGLKLDDFLPGDVADVDICPALGPVVVNRGPEIK